MDPIDKYIDLIEDYLDGNLSPDEKENFEKKLTGDPDLKRQYQLRVQLAKDWKNSVEYLELKSKINHVIKKDAKLWTSLKRYYLPLAAAVAVLIGLYYIFTVTPGNELNKDFAIDGNNDIIVNDSTTNDNKIMLKLDEIEYKAAFDSISGDSTLHQDDSITDLDRN